MYQAFAIVETEGALLVDATNALNSINRQAALHNISIICPSIVQDPLTMAMYALAVKPLINSLQSHCPAVKQASLVC